MATSKRKVKVIGSSRPIVFKVKFLATCHDGKFKKGDIVDLKVDSANHWIKRGLAERYRKAKKEEPPKKKPGRQAAKKAEPKEVIAGETGTAPEEKKTEDTQVLPGRKPPITVTDPTPEIEKDQTLGINKE